jgi:hypothetical protein
LQFEVNVEALNRAGLRASPQMLRLAKPMSGAAR